MTLTSEDCFKILNLIGFKGKDPCRDCGGEIWFVQKGVSQDTGKPKYMPVSPGLMPHRDACTNAPPRKEYQGKSSGYAKKDADEEMF